MPAIIVKLTCLTNLHVGNGDANYNIVDKEVEKDPVHGFPIINSSGVKGALRSHLKGYPDEVAWFGNDVKDKTNKLQGKLRILSANILARPYRATDGAQAYALVTFEESLRQYEQLCTAFGLKASKMNADPAKAAAEGYPLDEACYEIEGTKGIHIAKGAAADGLKKLALPVMARNNLENGISCNLWYEEVVPHESVFYFIVSAEENDRALLDSFRSAIEGETIQFGANASIGYGLCKVDVRGGENRE